MIIKKIWFLENPEAHIIASKSIFPQIKKKLIKKYLGVLDKDALPNLSRGLILKSKDYEEILNPRDNFGARTDKGMELTQGFIIEFLLEKAPMWVLFVLATSKYEIIQGQLIMGLYNQKRRGESFIKDNTKLLHALVYSDFSLVRKITKKIIIEEFGLKFIEALNAPRKEEQE